MDIECVVDSRSTVGEGAFWDEKEGCLWWVDIPSGIVNRFDPSTHSNEIFQFGEPVGCVVPRESGGLVVAAKSGLYHFDPNSNRRIEIGDPEADKPGNRFNDGGTDRQGRFWAGTMREVAPPSPDGAFYRLDSDGSIWKGIGGFFTTNGLAFSPDGKTMYAADSNKGVRSIWQFRYDTDDGVPSERRLFFDTSSSPWRPDGATIDEDGCYWFAGIDGWQVVRVTPRGVVDRTIDLPVERPTKPMFGGTRLDTMYVTSLSLGLKPGSIQPQAGSLFAISGHGARGIPEKRFRG
ncbi:MAG: SMP-30/gluconolactonase/LRE family protein [Albidovulum sp.]|nr:SMP-30/gluconolactonase/LRE family protein [Albidovulum sp.]MDE0529921.1 SMP-30/gluconolactonase/LRE family protein [Albidovulum sp.]